MVGIPVSKIRVIPNGLDTREFQLKTRDSIRSKHGWGPNDFVVGYVARFAAHKGHSFFLDVMQIVFEVCGEKLKVCFVGDGPNRNFVLEKARSLGLSSSVLFTGVIDNVNEYLSAFDASSLLSEYEGMPNSVMEAMAVGLPVIANPVGNVEELFHNESGIVNRSSDPRDAAQHFIRLLNDVDFRKFIGSSAKKRIEQYYSIEETLKQLKSAYGIE